MELNQNYPWYLQTSPNFVTLYEGMFNTAKNYSSLDSYKVFYPEIMAEISDRLGAMYGLKVYAGLWQIPVEFSAIVDALIYDVDNWSETKKWNGDVTGADLDWFLRYIKMKTFINQQPFCLNMIKNAMDILLGEESHNVTVTETEYAITVNLEISDEAATVVQGILVVDPTLVGKPVGKSLTFSLS